jgi:hypothetical protein
MQGIYCFQLPAGRKGGRKVIDAQRLFDRIPCSREQGILMAEQGKYVGDTEKPAAASPILDRAKGQVITGTAAELSAREGAPHHFLGNDCRYPATTIDGPSAARSANKRSMAS